LSIIAYKFIYVHKQL